MEGIIFYYDDFEEKVPVATVENVRWFFEKINRENIDLSKYEKETLYLWTLGTAFLLRTND